MSLADSWIEVKVLKMSELEKPKNHAPRGDTSTSKRHHVIPQFYQRRFADEKNRIALYDLKTSTLYESVPIKGQFTSKNCNRASDVFKDPLWLEKEFSRLEGEHAKILRTLDANRHQLSDEFVCGMLVSMFALQYIRTTAYRAWIAESVKLSAWKALLSPIVQELRLSPEQASKMNIHLSRDEEVLSAIETFDSVSEEFAKFRHVDIVDTKSPLLFSDNLVSINLQCFTQRTLFMPTSHHSYVVLRETGAHPFKQPKEASLRGEIVLRAERYVASHPADATILVAECERHRPCWKNRIDTIAKRKEKAWRAAWTHSSGDNGLIR